MSLLHGVSYGAVVVALLFVTLSLASGLLWIAEVIEEHSRIAKIVGQRIIYAVIAFHVLLYTFDANNLPFTHVCFSIGCHLLYLSNFANFPLINLTSWSFIASCLLVVANHFLWFFYFHNVLEEARKREKRWRNPIEPIPHLPTFLDISTFFGICVWLVPLFLFLSLSANDNALPTASRSGSTPTVSGFDSSRSTPSKPQRSSLFISIFAKAAEFFSSRRPLRGSSQRGVDYGLVRRPSPSHQNSSLLSPGLQRRATPPPTAPMTPHSPQQNPIASPSLSESWLSIDSGPPRGDDSVARRRGNPPAPRYPT